MNNKENQKYGNFQKHSPRIYLENLFLCRVFEPIPKENEPRPVLFFSTEHIKLIFNCLYT